MSIKEKQQELINDFAFLSDWEQKYEYIIDLGKELKGLPEEKKNEDILIKYASAFISGMKKGGVLPTVKHFPGNAETDPHLSKSIIDVDEDIFYIHHRSVYEEAHN